MSYKRTTPLICVIGKSGAGKTATIKESGLKEVVSYASEPRTMREGESQGNPYYFVSESEFLVMKEKGKFAECRPVYDHYKGVTWDELNSKEIFAITPDGVKELKSVGVDVYTVYISGEPFESRGRVETEFENVEYDYEIPNYNSIETRADLLNQIYSTLCTV